jgi:chemotaxis protein methyltransferase CheR
MKDLLPLSTDDFGLFQELLIEMSGLQFEEGRRQALHLALWQRLQHRGYDSYREYYNLLKFHPEGRHEIRELLDLITIGETYFFRNKAQFDVLMRFVLPEIIQRKVDSRDKCIRVWSAGCSGGDETYSIVLAMMEGIPSYKEWSISILGTDINRKGLASAKEGIYGQKHIGHLPREYLDKYFKVRGSTYVLEAHVRELVQFEYHNLARDPFIHEKMQNVDIIFCRNVTIYFDGKTTQRVIENFYNCFAQDGYLFLGHTETLWQITNKFERVEFPQTFIYKKRLSPIETDAMKPFMAIPEMTLEDLTLSAAPIPTFEAEVKKGRSWSTLSEPPTSGWEVEGPTSIEERGTEKRIFLQELRSGLQEKPEPLDQVQDPTLRVEKPPDMKEKVESAYKEAILCLKEIKDQTTLLSPNNIVAQDKNHIRASLTEATTLANEAKYKQAADTLAKIIEADNLSVEAYYLLGVLSYKGSDLKEAETQFRKVIYVDPDSVLAYFNLGNVYLYQRKFNEAAREFRNAIRLLEKRPKDEQVQFCEDFTVEFLLRACRNNLAEIAKRGE